MEQSSYIYQKVHFWENFQTRCLTSRFFKYYSRAVDVAFFLTLCGTYCVLVLRKKYIPTSIGSRDDISPNFLADTEQDQF